MPCLKTLSMAGAPSLLSFIIKSCCSNTSANESEGRSSAQVLKSEIAITNFWRFPCFRASVWSFDSDEGLEQHGKTFPSLIWVLVNRPVINTICGPVDLSQKRRFVDWPQHYPVSTRVIHALQVSLVFRKYVLRPIFILSSHKAQMTTMPVMTRYLAVPVLEYNMVSQQPYCIGFFWITRGHWACWRTIM